MNLSRILRLFRRRPDASEAARILSSLRKQSELERRRQRTFEMRTMLGLPTPAEFLPLSERTSHGRGH